MKKIKKANSRERERRGGNKKNALEFEKKKK